MIPYFEKQLAELSHSIHSLDEKEFTRCVKEATQTLNAGDRKSVV